MNRPMSLWPLIVNSLAQTQTLWVYEHILFSEIHKFKRTNIIPVIEDKT